MNSTETAGTPSYVINRVYLDDATPLTAASTGREQIVLNIGAVAVHLSPAKSFELQRAITQARLEHDIKWDEPARTVTE